jgi:hypothetical protein
MAKKDHYGSLTKEQRTKLKALLAAVAELPTENVLRECLRLRGVDARTEEGLAEIDRAMASCWAYERLMPYMMALRYFSGERESIGMQIYDYTQHPYPTHESEVPAKAYANLMAADLAGVQEVTFHFFCISVKHVLSYLTIAAESAGHELSKEDREFLDHYRDLRDYYEHFYNRLPGKPHEGAVVEKTISDEGYRVTGGLKVDSQQQLLLKVAKKDEKGKPVRDADGNIVLEEKAFDVTRHGMNRINAIVEENWRQIRKKAVDGLRQHFIANPENIPPPEAVEFFQMTGPGGYKPEET